MAEQRIRVFGAPWCPDCKRSKQFLGEQRIPYDWIDIEQDETGRKYVQQVNDGTDNPDHPLRGRLYPGGTHQR